MPASAGELHERSGWRRLAVRAAGALLAVGCAVLLVVRAGNGVHDTDSLSSTASIEQSAAQNAYYNCLSSEAQKLVPPGATVAISTGSQSADSVVTFQRDRRLGSHRVRSTARDRRARPRCGSRPRLVRRLGGGRDLRRHVMSVAP